MNATDVLDRGILALRQLLSDDIALELTGKTDIVSEHNVRGKLLLGGNELAYHAVKHRGVAPLRDLAADSRVKKREVPVFFVTHLSGADQARCREEGLNFVDTHGNCFLDVPGCFVLVSKVKNGPTSAKPTGKAFLEGGLRFLLAIYAEPELLNQPYRKISRETNISTGSLTAIFEDLKANDFLRQQEADGKLVLTNEMELTRRFAYNYLTDIRPKLSRGLFYLMGDDVAERIKKLDGDQPVLLGGNHAAGLRGNYLSAPDSTIYSDARIMDLAKHCRIVPVGNGSRKDLEVVEVFSTFGGRFGLGESKEFQLVSDLIIYADLLSSHNVRVQDAANRLLTHEIFSKFQQNWLRYGTAPGGL